MLRCVRVARRMHSLLSCDGGVMWLQFCAVLLGDMRMVLACSRAVLVHCSLVLRCFLWGCCAYVVADAGRFLPLIVVTMMLFLFCRCGCCCCCCRRRYPPPRRRPFTFCGRGGGVAIRWYVERGKRYLHALLTPS